MSEHREEANNSMWYIHTIISIPIMVRAKVRLPCVNSNSILTVAPVVLLDHPVAPALVAPLHKLVEQAEAVDKPQVVLEVVYQRAVRLSLPAQLDCRIFSELMMFYSPAFRLGSNAINYSAKNSDFFLTTFSQYTE